MIEGEQRKAQILAALQQADKPISATSFAKKFGVSRQIVVGDVALLRASGENIIATARGYLLERETEK
ncbi:MAG: HTH domain-containing protein, partial [Enterococcus viikkiensis]